MFPRVRIRSHALDLLERQGSIDQSDVRKGLGEVAECSSGVGIDLLGKQAHIVAVCKQSLKSLRCRARVASARETFDRQKLQIPNAPSPGGRPSFVSFAS